jgi:hypothetical protein
MSPAQNRGRYFRFTLAVLPFIGMLGMIPWANRTDPYILGMPFLLFWIVLWVVLTSVCMTLVYISDPANKAEAEK